MSRRRSIHRKHEQPATRKGLLLCLLLVGAVVLVPIGGGFMTVAKAKLAAFALASGLIDLNDCVVTASQAIACTNGAAGTPVPVALNQMAALQAQAAEDARRRDAAEAQVRTLTAEVDRLNSELDHNDIAAGNALAPSITPVVTTVTRIGTTDATSLPIQVLPNPANEPYEPAADE